MVPEASLLAWAGLPAVAWVGFAVYAGVVNLAGWPTMGRVFFPNAMWLILAISCLAIAPSDAAI